LKLGLPTAVEALPLAAVCFVVDVVIVVTFLETATVVFTGIAALLLDSTVSFLGGSLLVSLRFFSDCID